MRKVEESRNILQGIRPHYIFIKASLTMSEYHDVVADNGARHVSVYCLLPFTRDSEDRYMVPQCSIFCWSSHQGVYQFATSFLSGSCTSLPAPSLMTSSNTLTSPTTSSTVL